jgi:hypothetical protein
MGQVLNAILLLPTRFAPFSSSHLALECVYAKSTMNEFFLSFFTMVYYDVEATAIIIQVFLPESDIEN